MIICHYLQCCIRSDTVAVTTGSYSSSTKSITDKFKHIAEQLSSSNQDASDRFSKFNSSLKAIQTQLPSVLSGLNAQKTNSLEEDVRYFTGFVEGGNNNINSKSSSGAAKKSSPHKSGGIAVNGAGDGENSDSVIDKLIEHLEGSN